MKGVGRVWFCRGSLYPSAVGVTAYWSEEFIGVQVSLGAKYAAVEWRRA